jgi:TatD DNase family protein
MLVDTHAHLTMPELSGELPALLQRAAEAGVAGVVCVGIDLASSRQAIDIAGRYPQVAATVGVHANDCADLPSGWLDELRGLAGSAGVVAIGEIGLDYYWKRVERQRQREVFQAQLELAEDLALPVVIHNRDAGEDLTGILLEWAAGLPAGHPRGVLHCFSGDRDMMDSCCSAGFFVSFAGPITFRNSRGAAEMVAAAPPDRLLIETDSPYLAPHPHRGKRNEPSLLRLVAERMAEIRGVSLDQIADATTRNAERLFGLEVAPVTTRGS